MQYGFFGFSLRPAAERTIDATATRFCREKSSTLVQGQHSSRVPPSFVCPLTQISSRHANVARIYPGCQASNACFANGVAVELTTPGKSSLERVRNGSAFHPEACEKFEQLRFENKRLFSF